MNTVLAPSILSADFKHLGDQIKATEKGGAAYLHFDVMDGMFVPNISFGVPVLESIKGYTEQILDVHLMVTEPIRYVEKFAQAGADIITVHLEACEDIHATIEKIKACNVKAAVSIKPQTPVSEVEPLLSKLSMVLVMSVEPGFGGQSFIPESLERIRRIREMITAQGLDVDIEVDGGISVANVREVQAAGANIFVMGSAVFRDDIEDNVRKVMEKLG